MCGQSTRERSASGQKMVASKAICHKAVSLPHMDGSIVFVRWRHACFLGSTRIHIRNSISIGSAVFAGLTIVTDRQTDRLTDKQTDRPRYSVYNYRPHLHSSAMQPNNNKVASCIHVLIVRVEMRGGGLYF